MAVFTPITRAQLISLLESYDIGEYDAHMPVANGSENTTYELVTTLGRFAVTLFETRTPTAALPYFLGLMHHVHEAKLPVSRLVITVSGRLHENIDGRPVAIVEWARGNAAIMPTPRQCFLAGRMLAKFHSAAIGYEPRRSNPMGPGAWPPLLQHAQQILGDSCIVDQLRDDFHHVCARWPSTLPSGAIHADYFPDNVLFDANEVSGVIDFGFACTDLWALDLAIAHSAWGFSSTGVPRMQCMVELIRGYQSVRKLAAAELEAMPILCMGAALRFSLTRLCDSMSSKDACTKKAKDPFAYLRRLEWYRGMPQIPTEHTNAICE